MKVSLQFLLMLAYQLPLLSKFKTSEVCHIIQLNPLIILNFFYTAVFVKLPLAVFVSLWEHPEHPGFIVR